MSEADTASSLQFSYGISPVILGLGIGCLGGVAMMIGLSGWHRGIDSIVWWSSALVVGGLLAAVIWSVVLRRRSGGLAVALTADEMSVPGGLFGTRTRKVPLEAIGRIRVVRKASLRGGEGRELVYIVFDDSFVVLASELFATTSAYRSFFRQLVASTRQAKPDVRVDVDGEEWPKEV